jgi:hypothetical protein
LHLSVAPRPHGEPLREARFPDFQAHLRDQHDSTVAGLHLLPASGKSSGKSRDCLRPISKRRLRARMTFRERRRVVGEWPLRRGPGVGAPRHARTPDLLLAWNSWHGARCLQSRSSMATPPNFRHLTAANVAYLTNLLKAQHEIRGDVVEASPSDHALTIPPRQPLAPNTHHLTGAPIAGLRVT